MLREMCMMANSRMIKLMGLEYTPTSTDPDMKVIGKMICKRVMEVKYGVITLAIQEVIKKERSMDTVLITG
jgi:hypothetical protein